MKLRLEIHFNTDGDFCFLWLDRLIDPKCPFYEGVIKTFSVDNCPDYEEIDILLECSGNENCCRGAARDVLENLVAGGIRSAQYYLVKYLYDFLITPREEVLWSDDDVHYQDTISGSYEGTILILDITH